ncbi:cytochrome P450 [Inquilinus sp. NPDC058860]|uniref:cytochrome P450 n=1 Tax=Inquilinus sp. NPDC058860 TaxID=3346652 RepID=UPI00369E9549
MLKPIKPRSSDEHYRSRIDSFDHHSPECTEDIYNLIPFMHRECPIFHSRRHDGFYVVTKYEDLMEVVRRPEIFSAGRGFEIPEHPAPTLIPFHYDPPASMEYRRLLNRYFSPDAVRAWAPEFRRSVLDRIEPRLATGSLDVVGDVARPAISALMLRIVGLDPDGWEAYAAPIHNFVHRLVPRDVAWRDFLALGKRLETDIRAFRDKPVPGSLLAGLLDARFQGRALSEIEIGRIVNTLLMAGFETTQASIGTAVVYLGQNPDRRRELIDAPEALPGAVDEFLRVFPAQMAMGRTVMADTELHGVRLRKGDKVLLLWHGGNFDEERFPSPFEVEFRRQPNPHLSFGAGGHKCLGMHLARMEIAVCLQAILERLPDFRVEDDRLRFAPDCSVVFGFEGVPITFDTGRWQPP